MSGCRERLSLMKYVVASVTSETPTTWVFGSLEAFSGGPHETRAMSALRAPCVLIGTRWCTSASLSSLPAHLESRASRIGCRSWCFGHQGRGSSMNLLDVMRHYPGDE